MDANKKVLVGLGIGCGLLFVLLLMCGGGAVVLWMVAGRYEYNTNVTKENFDKLQTDMSLAQVEAILGPGREAGPDDIPDLPYSGPPGGGGDIRTTFQERARQGRVLRWKNGQTDGVLLVSFTAPPRENGRSESILYAVIRSNGLEAHWKGKGFGGN
jgi:hypothetical protein